MIKAGRICVVAALLVGTTSVPVLAQSASGSDGLKDEGPEDATSDTTQQLFELLLRASNHPDLRGEFDAKRDKARWQQFRAKWAWAPEIQSTSVLAPVPANADPDQLQNNVDEIGSLEIGPFFNQDVRITAPLYTFGKIATARELAALGIDANELAREGARLEVILQLKQAYYGLQLSNSFSSMLEEGDKLIGEQLEKMDEARDFGEADFDIKDFRKLQIFGAEVDSRLVDNRRLAAIASDGIRYLADLDEQDAVEVGALREDEAPESLRELDYYLEVSRRMRVELLRLDKAVEARRLEFELERAKWYPDLFGVVNFGFGWSTERVRRQEICVSDASGICVGQETPRLTAEPYREPFDRLSLGLGVGLRWNVNPVGQYGKTREKESQLHTVRAQKRRAQGAIELEVRKLYRDAADALTKITIQARRVEAARRWRDQLGFSIESAGANLKDAVEPLKAFYEARALYLEARMNYLVARARLAKAVGAMRLLPDGEAVRHLRP